MTQMLRPPALKPIPETALEGEPAPFFILEDVSWEFYEETLEEMDRQKRHIRISYDDGRMEFMTLTNRHEQNKKTVARFVEAYADAREIDVDGVGSVTLKKKEKRKGLEPNECYYVKTRAPGMKVMQLDLKKYPPPDLAIEIDITRGSMNRQPIYGAIGVPEIWRFDGEMVVVLQRRRNGKYRTVAKSAVFPKLPIERLNHFLSMANATSQRSAIRAFRAWLRENP